MVWGVLLICLQPSISSVAYANLVSGKVDLIGDTTHIEFQGKDKWNYSINRISNKKLEIVVPAFGEETEKSLLQWSKGFVKHISIDKNGPDNTYKLTFHLSDEDVESFDYLTDQPSRLIVDLYKQTEPNNKKKTESPPLVSQNQADKKKKTTKVAKGGKNEVTKDGYTKVQTRKPSSSELLQVDNSGSDDGVKSLDPSGESSQLDVRHGVFDAGDKLYDRFRIRDYKISEEAIIASRQNIYIRFPMVNIEFKRLDDLLEHPPIYKIKAKETKENKEARLLLTQYEKRRFGGFFKTYNYFEKQYPKSHYKEILGYVAADMYYYLYKRDKDRKDLNRAIKKYESLVIEFPESVLKERTDLLLAYFALEKKESLQAIQKMSKYLEDHPKSDERDTVLFGLAQGYRYFNKPEMAKEIYDRLEKEGKTEEVRAQAVYRKGDIYFDGRKMDQAISSYKEALKRFPASKSVYPNAFYNMGEAQFWTGHYKEALENLVNFIKYFPDHSSGGYALTRIGELLDILGADKSQVIGAFLESYFRYRSSDGAEIARARMISERLHHMKETEVKKSLEEISDLAKRSKLLKMKEFVTLMVADGLYGRKEYRRALSYLVTYFQRNPTSNNLDFFKKRILKNISKILIKEVASGNYIEALRFYGENANTWLKNSDRIDILHTIGNAYELVGVRDEARKRYIRVVQELDRISGTEEGKERKVNEHLPSKESVYLRLAAVSIEGRKYHQGETYLRAIQNDDKLSPVEKVEKVESAATIFEAMGDAPKAIEALQKLTKSWADEPELLMPVYYRLAKLNYQLRKYSKAEVQLGFLTEIHNDNPDVHPELWSKSLRLLGDVLLAQGRGVAAVKEYMALLNQFEDKYPLESVRYKAGLVLFERGDLVGAEKIWSALESGEGKTYRKLADEKLGNAKWKDEYKKYIDRIPAAKGL